MTQTDFNPYRDWLGLESPPVSYYDLLGLPTGESDVERIRSASIRALSTLRSIKPGNHQVRWRTLLDQLEAARDCLLAEDQKARYDQRLGHRVASLAAPATTSQFELPTAAPTTAPTPAPSSISLVQPETDPMAPVEFSAVRPARVASRFGRGRLARSRRRPSPAMAYALFGMCFVAVLVAFVGILQWWILPARKVRQHLLATFPQAAHDLPLPVDEFAELVIQPDLARQPPPVIDDVAQTRPESGDEPERGNATSDSLARAPSLAHRAATDLANGGLQTDAAVVAELAEPVNTLLRDSFAALRDQRWDDARAALDRARLLAPSTAHSARIERFATLLNCARQYRQAFEDGLQDLAGSELMYGGQPVMVVDVTADEIVIRMQGQNNRFPRDEPPTELVMAIADQWFDPRAATTQVFRSAFMLVTPSFTAENVRAAWQSARQSGTPLGDLWQILDDLEALQLGFAE